MVRFRRGLSPSILGFCSLALCAAAVSFDAHADTYWFGYQVACSKELGYFSFRSIVVDSDAVRIEANNNTYYIAQLEKEPYICELPGQSIKIEIDKRSTMGRLRYCAGLAGNPVADVFINGVKQDSFYIFENPCLDRQTHLIQIDKFSLQDCTLPDRDLNASVTELSCKNKRLFNHWRKNTDK